MMNDETRRLCIEALKDKLDDITMHDDKFSNKYPNIGIEYQRVEAAIAELEAAQGWEPVPDDVLETMRYAIGYQLDRQQETETWSQQWLGKLHEAYTWLQDARGR